MGWQDCITRLLVKKPITDVCSEVFPDLMSFDDDGELLDLDPGRVSPSSASRISDAAFAIETEIKEVAETVSNAVADNIHYAADNISSAVASAYTAFRQKTVEMQESLEEFGSRSRLKKRSLSSLAESSEPEPDSPRPPRSPLDLDPNLITRSGSSSSTEELSSPSHSHSVDQASTRDSLSLTSQLVDDNSDDDEKILFDALQRWRVYDAEKLEDKEEELCYLVANLVFTIMWRGIDINSKDAWKERGQVMTCINLLALNNTLYCSHLELKLRLLEMAVTAALSDLREGSYTADNAAQLIRWIYDLTVIDPNQDHSKKASTKLLDGVLGLLDALLVFQEVPGEEWTEMAKLAFGILLSCAASSNLELCAMATAKLHTLVQTRCMKDAEEGGYLLYYINTIVQQSLEGGNQEHYSFLMPVVKALIEKLSDLLTMPSHLPDLPQTLSGPTFFEHFQNFCRGEQWTAFMEKQAFLHFLIIYEGYPESKFHFAL
ncbi:hypothetical protein J6590_102043 [Homalodisca vitripennis]|nr:hypothetical protein J6590_102043 [Homalodisca vitripennis]